LSEEKDKRYHKESIENKADDNA
jgi:hypothetical protein